MRGIPRKAAFAALTTVVALGASSSAWAVGADDIRMDLTAAVSPNQLPNKSKGVSLFVQPTWVDEDGSPATGAEGAEEVRLDFDDDITLSTKKLPKCNVEPTGPGGLDTLTTEQAIAACGSSQVGSGSAKARVPSFGPGAPFFYEAAEIDITVTAFNGPKSTAGQAECNDTSLGGPYNCEWVGGKPTLYLHTYNRAFNNIGLVRGEIQDADDTLPGAGTPAIAGGYGQRLAVTDGTDVAGDVGAISLFNALVGKKYTYKKGKKKVRADYVSAKCNPADDVDSDAGPAPDPGVQKGLQFKAHTVYDDDASHSEGTDPSVDTDRTFVRCG